MPYSTHKQLGTCTSDFFSSSVFSVFHIYGMFSAPFLPVVYIFLQARSAPAAALLLPEVFP
ncbi:MAG: hypothetical protein HYZ42_02055 [Bacteroidetes bacterium]|nr:hypothetical protein [Bacteroidota bacterium]